MPLFRRPDGDLVSGETPVRRIMPYFMLGRNESIVFHEAHYEIAKARAFLRRFNHAHEREQPATLFHYFLWACGQGLAQRPGLNRFVSGGRLYQRKGMYITFAAKKELADDAPLVTVKMKVWEGEPFADFVKRTVDAIKNARHGPGGTVDKELAIALRLPGWLLRVAMAALRWLDRVNLMPGIMIENDPLYTSLFVANLGSVGLDRCAHHLYEYGTAAMFAVLGAPRKQLALGRDGKPESRDVLEVRWSLDERVNDGLYCARGLAHFKKIFENPDDHVKKEAAAQPAAPVIAAGDGDRTIAMPPAAVADATIVMATPSGAPAATPAPPAGGGPRLPPPFPGRG